MSFKQQNLEWDIPLSDVQIGETIGFTADLSATPFYNPILYTFDTFSEETASIPGKFAYSLDDGETWTDFPEDGEVFTQAFKLRLTVNYGETSNVFAYYDSVLHQITPDGKQIVDSIDTGIINDGLHFDSTQEDLYIAGPSETLYKFSSQDGLKLGDSTLFMGTDPLAVEVDGMRQSFWYVDNWNICLRDLFGNLIFCVPVPDEIAPIDLNISSSTSSESSEGPSSSSSWGTSSSSSSSSLGYSSDSSSSSLGSSSSSSSEGTSSSSSLGTSSSSSSEGTTSSSSSSLIYVCETAVESMAPDLTGYITAMPLLSESDFEFGSFVTEYKNGHYESVGLNGSWFAATDPANQGFWWRSYYDHTVGDDTGKMLLFDLGFGEQLLYGKTVYVVAGEDYTFSIWSQFPRSSIIGSPFNVFFYINGSYLGSQSFDETTGPFSWTEFTASWNSGTSTQAYITIIPQVVSGDIGNREGTFDDISLDGPQSAFKVVSSLEYGNGEPLAWKAFNNDTYSEYGFYGSINDLGFGYISLEIPGALIVDTYSFSNKNLATTGGANPAPTHWKLQASNVASPDYTTDSDWTDLHEGNYLHWDYNTFDIPPSYDYSTVCLYDIGNTTAYIHYRIKVIAVSDPSGYFYINDVKFQEAVP